jgi:hypothetical protein
VRPAEIGEIDAKSLDIFIARYRHADFGYMVTRVRRYSCVYLSGSVQNP